MSEADFGGLIKRSRERLGLSQSRVAELIGRSTGTVRAWERGTSEPSDGGVVSSLAAVLGIDETVLFESVGLEPPVRREAVTVEQALRSITPDADDDTRPGEALARVISRPDRKPEAEPETDPDTAVDEEPERPGQMFETSTSEIEPPERAATTTPADRAVSRGSHTRADPITAERAGIVDRLRAATVRKPRSTAPLTTLPTAPPAPSYMEDADERLSYRLRSIFTIVGVVILLIAMAWAGTNLLDALADLWGELTANF